MFDACGSALIMLSELTKHHGEVKTGTTMQNHFYSLAVDHHDCD